MCGAMETIIISVNNILLFFSACKVSAADVAYIHHPFHCDYVWGLEGIVEMAEPRSLKQFLYLLELLSIEQMRSRDRRDGYSVCINFYQTFVDLFNIKFLHLFLN